jgi:hypothetical protein
MMKAFQTMSRCFVEMRNDYRYLKAVVIGANGEAFTSLPLNSVEEFDVFSKDLTVASKRSKFVSFNPYDTRAL